MALPLPTDPTVPPIISQARRLALGDSELARHMADAAGGLAVNLTLAALILVVTVWASGWLSRMTVRGIERAHRNRPVDTTLQNFAASLVRYFIVIVGLIGVLQQLGVKATSVIAVLGAASLAIGLALQGALANVAAGVMILILRPYRIGDEVVINGRQGVVKGLDLFATRLADPDNLAVFVPNAKAFGEIIVNNTSTAARRIQLDFTIDYDDDVQAARRLALAVATADPRVLAKPAPWAHLTALQDSGVTVTLRAWTTPGDWGEARSDLMAEVKARFEAAGLTFPYPHQVAVEDKAPAPKPAPSRRSASPRPTRAATSRGR